MTTIRTWHKGAEPPDAQQTSSRKPPTRKSRDVYCYFDNTDVKLRAPFDARTLMRRLGLQAQPPLNRHPDREIHQPAADHRHAGHQAVLTGKLNESRRENPSKARAAR